MILILFKEILEFVNQTSERKKKVIITCKDIILLFAEMFAKWHLKSPQASFVRAGRGNTTKSVFQPYCQNKFKAEHDYDQIFHRKVLLIFYFECERIFAILKESPVSRKYFSTSRTQL